VFIVHNKKDKTMTITIIPPALIRTLRHARRVTILTGAGISAESGVPTFRDAQTGLWTRYKPEELATPEAFRRHPKLVWDWYTWRRQLVRKAQPNPGHRALVELERRIPDFTLITQNVDGLHQRAGSQRVLELHGNLFRNKCFQEGMLIESWENDEANPPQCFHCGAWLRPDVVWFGEPLPVALLAEADVAAAQSEVFFSIGTSTLVYPAAELPFLALSNAATVVEINPQYTPLSAQATFSLRGTAGELLPKLVKETWEGEA
jgi:NAD-dependent deacetylase